MRDPRSARYARALVAALSLLGCRGEDASPSPTAPGTAPNAPAAPSPAVGAWVWVMVLENSGLCIPGATVAVVGGEGVGQSFTQTRPCDAWSYDPEVLFVGLTPGAAVTLRASAPGYAAKEVTAYAQLSGQATEIVLTRTP